MRIHQLSGVRGARDAPHGVHDARRGAHRGGPRDGPHGVRHGGRRGGPKFAKLCLRNTRGTKIILEILEHAKTSWDQLKLTSWCDSWCPSWWPW